VRVVVINQHLEEVTGGSELQCDLVARGLSDRGHDVTYLAIAGRGAARSVGPYRRESVTPGAADVLAACRRISPDVVYWRYGRDLLAQVARGLAHEGVPLVLAVAHVDDVTRLARSRRPASRAPRAVAGWVRGQLRSVRSYRALRHVAAIASQRVDLLDVAPVARQRVVRNLLGPDLLARAARDDVPTPPDRPYVAWVGNLKPRKRPELCLVLADALAPLGIDVLMAGGVQDEASGRLVRPDPDRPNLRHLGLLPRDEVLELLAGARCTAITYRPEGFSNVLLQSWALGTPTVSLDYDPDGLVAAEGLGGFADGDLATFVDMVVGIASDDTSRAVASRAARAVIEASFDDERSLDELERLFVEVSGVDRGRDAQRHG